jgi:hypothetical protein
MLKATSVFLDVIQGTDHPHAKEYRRFCREDWPHMEAVLNQGNHMDILPRICREVQVKMVTYLRRLTGRLMPDVPAYQDITEDVLHEKFSNLNTLPPAYMVAPATAGGATAGGGAGAGTRGGAATGRDRSAGPGQAVSNPRPVNAWKDAWVASGRNLRDLPRQHIPKTGDGTQICLSWHIKGSCFERCEREATHRNLSGTERTAMTQFVQQHVRPPTAAAAGTTAGTNV